MTNVGAFPTFTSGAWRIRRAPVTAPPYRGEVNEALVAWLMTAPDVPDETLPLEDFLRRPEWHQPAACRGLAPARSSQWLPTTSSGLGPSAPGCTVRDECYSYAMSDPDLMGFWAGFTAKERKALRCARVA